MIEHIWTVACNKCIVDPTTNNATLVEVFEQISVAQPMGFPVVAPLQVDLVSLWNRTNVDRPTRGSGRFSTINPDGTHTNPAEYAIDLIPFHRCRTIARLAGLPLVGPGVYYFQVELRLENQEWQRVAKIPFVVVLLDNPAPAAGAH